MDLHKHFKQIVVTFRKDPYHILDAKISKILGTLCWWMFAQYEYFLVMEIIDNFLKSANRPEHHLSCSCFCFNVPGGWMFMEAH